MRHLGRLGYVHQCLEHGYRLGYGVKNVGFILNRVGSVLDDGCAQNGSSVENRKDDKMQSAVTSVDTIHPFT